MGHWMFECQEVSKLVSEAMDKKLSVTRRLGIRFHLMMCKLCSRYARQIQLIRTAARCMAKVEDCTVDS
ncbi:MAG: hypothetical protein JRH15_14405, partial [Deltaproteobacteria bacterium]|nr:hypothetical protein [Deltaproteobacteria bacterium]